MQEHDLDRSEEHHLRRFIAALEPRLQRGLPDPEMSGELRRAAEDEARTMQRAGLRRLA